MKFVTLPTSTGQAKFTFDDEGRMLYGWIDESGEMLTDDDAWKSGMYYCSDNGDGRMATGWKYITAVNDEDDDREGDGYWFIFPPTAKRPRTTTPRKSTAGNTDLMKTAQPTLNGITIPAPPPPLP